MKLEENLPRSFFETLKSQKFPNISKFEKSELGKFIPNFPVKDVIMSTNIVINLKIEKFSQCDHLANNISDHILKCIIKYRKFPSVFVTG